MAQLSTVLPTDFLIGIEGGLTFPTTVFDGATGIESRNGPWASGRYGWTLTVGGLLAEVQPVLDLFEEAKGMTFSFLFTPPPLGVQGDYRFNTSECRASYQNGAAGYIVTWTFSVIEVLDE